MDQEIHSSLHPFKHASSVPSLVNIQAESQIHAKAIGNDKAFIRSFSLTQCLWQKLQKNHSKIQLWHIVASIIGYLTICDLLDLLI